MNVFAIITKSSVGTTKHINPLAKIVMIFGRLGE